MTRPHIPRLALAPLAVLLAAVLATPSAADTRPLDPANPATPVTVSADALPTVQIDGVVWQQAVIGTTVYAAGSFSSARPAGAPAGTNEVPRHNLLAYDLVTGTLRTAFVADLNAQVRTVAASPDGTRVYVGGDFSTVNGRARKYLAALDPTTGALLDSFAPALNYQVKALVATDGTVYVGGSFSTVNGVARSRLAALTPAGGLLPAFAPLVPDGSVLSMVLSPGGTRLVVGGSFTSLDGSSEPGYGLGQVDANDGHLLPFPPNSVVRDGGENAAILSLTSDGTSIFGSGYKFGGGNLEGAFSANWSDSALRWIEDCHGDTYGVATSGQAVYVAGHPHTCANANSFGETTPRTFHRGLALSQAATSTVQHNLGGSTYYDFGGQPAPTVQNWFPDISSGTYTGQSQGPWTVAAAGGYVLYGGEFTSVNHTLQQGLVRFATADHAPNKQGPRATGADFTPTVVQLRPGVVKISWPANWDRDNANLTYTVYQDNVAVNQSTSASQFWLRPTLSFSLAGVAFGTHTYKVAVKDPFNNTVTSPSVSQTVG